MDVRRSRRRKGSSRSSKRYPQPLNSRTSVDHIEEATQPYSRLQKIKGSRMHLRHQEANPLSSPEAGSSKTARISRSPSASVIKEKNQADDVEEAKSSRRHSKKRRMHSLAAEEAEQSNSVENVISTTKGSRSERSSSTSSDTRARLQALEEENARLQKEVISKNGLLEKQRETISYIYGQCSCTVCMELVWRPHVLSPCGHVFCARCLIAWFTKPTSTESVLPTNENADIREVQRRRTLRRSKVCPHCREKVVVAPVEVWLVKGLLDYIDKSMKEGQGNEDHLVQGQDSLSTFTLEAIKEAKGEKLPGSKAIWKDIFADARMDEPMYDEEDRVYRCNFCANEVANGACTNPSCGMLYNVIDLDTGSEGSLNSLDDYDDFDEDDLHFLVDDDDDNLHDYDDFDEDDGMNDYSDEEDEEDENYDDHHNHHHHPRGHHHGSYPSSRPIRIASEDSDGVEIVGGPITISRRSRPIVLDDSNSDVSIEDDRSHISIDGESSLEAGTEDQDEEEEEFQYSDGDNANQEY